MEKLPVKINELSPIIISLIEKVQLLDSVLLTKQEKLYCTKEMIEVVDNFRSFFAKASKSVPLDESTRIFNERVERAFSEFDWDSNVAVSPFEFRKYSENAKSLISSILKLLGTKGCGILMIETYLKLCQKFVLEMTENVDKKNSSVDIKNFKSLLDGFSLTVNMFKKYWHIALLPNQRNSIMLCLNQICKILPFLLKMIEVRNVDVKKFSLKMLNQCLIRILDEVHCDGSFQAKNCGQEFINLMGLSLHKLNELSQDIIDFSSFIQKANECASSLKPLIDEILCHVMSIAQVTPFDKDQTAIMTGSQRVLREFNEFSNDIKEENGCGIKLCASSLGESLCSLERQVNTAVLRLVLEVFSGINSPLKNIVNKCRTDIAKDNKASEDLNVLISDFDAEMDRIMQIGFFTISCTCDLNRILRIQSCLASLESLETELIPSLTALYVECDAKNKSNFQYLIDFWLNEISELKILIDSVLDPAGFCEVVKVEVKNLVTNFRDITSSATCVTKAKSILKQIIRYSKKLDKTIKTSLEDENYVKDETKEYLKKFQLAVQECEAVLNLLGEEEDTNKTVSRALKRCEYLSEMLNKLSSHLFELAYEEDSESDLGEKTIENERIVSMQIPKEDYYKLCSASPKALENTNEADILTPYINKGILRSKKRNILYTTPLRNTEELKENLADSPVVTKHWDNTPISRKRSRCCKPLSLNLELGNTIDLEITTILENVSRLSNTFSKGPNLNNESQSNVEVENEREEKKIKDVACGNEKTTESVPTKLVSRGCCANLNLVKEENPKKSSDGDENKEKNPGDENFLGTKLRNQLQQSLNALSQNSSLLASNEYDSNNQVETLDRINDIKIVEQRINFLKQQVPCILP